MKLNRRFVLIGTVVALVAGVLLNPHAARAVQAGGPAPAFQAVDAAGRTRSLAEFAGKPVVLEWSNHQCPYVRKHYETGNMQALQREAAAQGVVWLTVISSAPGQEGYVTGAEAQRLTTARNAAPTDVLLDPTGALGRLYGARSTPHMFVISADRRVVYQGGIDDRNTTDHAAVHGARNYVREALSALHEGRQPAVAAARSYGCSVKYEH